MTAPLPRKVAAPHFGERAALAFVLVFVAAVPFAVIAALVKEASPSLQRLDQGVANDLHRFALDHPNFSTSMRVISDCGKPIVWWILLAPLAAWLAYRKLIRLASFVAVTAIGSSLLNLAIKTTVNRARPKFTHSIATAAGKSFPSGHTQAAVVGFGIIVLVLLPMIAERLRVWLVVVAALMVLLIGLSRIALGVHYLSDVVGGLLVGIAWLALMIGAFSKWRREEGKPGVDVSEGLEPENVDRMQPGGRSTR